MRIFFFATALLFTILSNAEATPACMRPISPLYVDIYGFDEAQMEYIRESKTNRVTVHSDTRVKVYHYNTNFTLDQVTEKTLLGKNIFTETFTYNTSNQLKLHRKVIYLEKVMESSGFLKRKKISSLEFTIENDSFAYDSQGNITYAHRRRGPDFDLTTPMGQENYPRFLWYDMYHTTIKLQTITNDTLVYTCTSDSSNTTEINFPETFYVKSDTFLGYKNKLGKAIIQTVGDTVYYRLEKKAGQNFILFTNGSCVIYDRKNNSERTYSFGWLSTVLIEKNYNNENVLISRIDYDYWGRQDTTTYHRNKENNRIEYITSNYMTTRYSHEINKEPKTIIEESSEKMKVSYE